ncbi:MAG: hypothetical protein R3B99_31105 [Polyangiales bacterium]
MGLKLSLALAEGLTAPALAGLARRIGARSPQVVALVAWAVAVAPGGSFFGQIDVWGRWG